MKWNVTYMRQTLFLTWIMVRKRGRVGGRKVVGEAHLYHPSVAVD